MDRSERFKVELFVIANSVLYTAIMFVAWLLSSELRTASMVLAGMGIGLCSVGGAVLFKAHDK
jgi:hypothetical protein